MLCRDAGDEILSLELPDAERILRQCLRKRIGHRMTAARQILACGHILHFPVSDLGESLKTGILKRPQDIIRNRLLLLTLLKLSSLPLEAFLL